MFCRALVIGGLFQIISDRSVQTSELLQQEISTPWWIMYIYMKKSICTKDINCFQDISVEKDFEVFMTELVDYGYIILCTIT